MTKIKCDQCQQRIGVEMLIPSPVWEQIARGDYALCPVCMDVRLVEQGLSVEGVAFFPGRGVHTRITPEIHQAVQGWRPGPACVDRVGSPTLFDSPIFQWRVGIIND